MGNVRHIRSVQFVVRLLAFAFFCLCLGGNAFGASLIWAVNGTFTDGGTVQGTFDFDPSTSAITSWKIYATGGSFTSYAYNPISAPASGGTTSITFTSSGRVLTLNFATALTTAGGTVNLATTSSETAGTSRTISSGTVGAASNQVTTFPAFPGSTSNLTIGTPSLPLAAKASGGSLTAIALAATFGSTTPSVCKAAQSQILLLGTGTCTIQSAAVSRNFTVRQSAASGTLSLSSGSPFAVGSAPTVQAVGDFDEDGKADLAVVDFTSGGVTILKGDGAGGFSQLGGLVSTAASPTSIAIADFNLDGHLDLAISSSASSNVTILLGNGTGAFVAASGSPFSLTGTNSNPVWIAAGDVNGDGRPDLVTVSPTNDTVTVLIGDSVGGFALDAGGPYHPAGPSPNFVAVADMNNDGVPDLLVVNSGGPSVTVMPGTGVLTPVNGSGSALFTSGTTFTVGNQPGTAVFGDFNGDGRMDFAVPSHGGQSIYVFLGQAAGGFSAATGSPISVSGSLPDYLATGDFNGDGKLDLVFASFGSPGLAIMLGDGSGNFSMAAGSPFAISSNTPGLPVVGDFNGDQRDDIAAPVSAGNSVGVLLGKLATTSTTLTSTAPLNITANTAVPLTATLSGTSFSPLSGLTNSVQFLDNGTPITTASQSGTTVTFTISAGFASGVHNISAVYQSASGNATSTSNTLTFTVGTAQTINFSFSTLPQVTTNTSPFSIATYASATSGLTVQFFSNSTSVCTTGGANGATVTIVGFGTCSITANQPGNGTFAAAAPVTQTFNVLLPQTITFDTIPTQIFGVPPFAVTVQSNSGLHVNLNVLSLEACAVAGNVVLLRGAGTCSIQATQPGDSTFAAAAPVTNNFTITSGPLSGTLSASSPLSFTGPNQPPAMATGDFNRDGLPDVVIANDSANTVTVFLSNVINGGYTVGSPIPVGNSPSAIAVADFNADGALDIFVTNSGDGTATVLLGNRAGGFAPSATSPVTVGGGAIAGYLGVADFNGDGFLDVAVPDVSTQNLTFMYGDGTGGFTSGLYGSLSGLGGIAVADFDGDGNADVVHLGSNNLNILYGNGNGTFFLTENGPFGVGTSPIQVIPVDLNGDGFPDLVVNNRTSNDVTVLLNNLGNGTFTPATGSPFALKLTSPGQMAVADFNGDGNSDIVVADALSPNLKVLLGDGSGSFVPAASLFGTGNSSPAAVLATADFNGDGREDIAIGRADDNLVFLSGGTQSTTSTISSTSLSTITSGTSVPLTVTVAGANPSFSAPTGTVTLFDNSSPLGTASETTSPYSFSTTPGVGSQSYTAQYAGNGAFSGSTTPTPVNITVVTAGSTTQTITFNQPPNQVAGTPLSIGTFASSTSGLTVQFASNSTSVCTVSGAAGATVNFLTNGTCSVTASQPGNTTFAPATPVTKTFQVFLPQTISFDAIPGQILGSYPYIIGAKATSLLPLTFISTTSAVCQVSDVFVTLKTTGTCSIQAQQGGDGTYNAATSVTRSFTVTKASPSAILSIPNTFGLSDSSPFASATADFNNDGIPDVVITTSNGAVVELGDIMSSFSQSAFLSISCPAAVVTGDFNADGNIDIALHDNCNNLVAAFLGDGSGGFTPATGGPFSTGPGSGPVWIAAGDFNGDGIQDLVTANFFSGNFTVAIGNGSGQFTPTNSASVGFSPVSVAVADFDQDGKSDIALLNGAGGNVHIFLGDGAGNFTQTTGPFGTGSAGPQYMFAADLNLDGKVDLAIANTAGGTVTALLNQGSGNFVAGGNSPFNTNLSDGILAVADVNGDGFPDIAQTDSANGLLNIFLGDGTGRFNPAANNPFSTGNVPTAVVAADFNRDGIQDLAVINDGDNNFGVYLGGTVGTTTTISSTSPSTITSGTNVPLTVTVSSSPTAFAPPTGSVTLFDNFSVIGTASQTSSPYSFTVNSPATGSHSYTAQYSGGSGSAGSNSFNSVGITVQGGNSQTITFNPLPNVTLGVGPFTVSATASSGLTVQFVSNTTSVCTTSGSTGSTVTILTGGLCSIIANQAGNGTFAAATPVTQSFTVLLPQTITFDTIPTQIYGGSPFAIAVQSNSLLPVTLTSLTTSVCSAASNLVMVLSAGTCSIRGTQAGNSTYAAATPVTTSFNINTAVKSGTLSEASGSPITVGSTPLSVAVGDLNGDGFKDVVVADFGSNAVTVLLGNGSGGFTEASGSPFSTGASTSPESVVIGDFNGDGKPDIATANTAGSVTVLLGDGSGAYTTAAGSPITVAGSPRAVAIGDVNGDGIQDLVTANQTGNTVTVLLGNGSGGFTPSTPVPVGSVPVSVVVGDFNGDGFDDIAAANQRDNSVTVLLGNGSNGFAPAAGSPFTVGTGPTTLVAADFNSDQKLDLATANQNSGDVTVLLGNGLGGFIASSVPLESGVSPYGLAVIDINGDAIPDLITTNQTTSGATVLLGDGTGGFGFSLGSPFPVGTNPRFVAVGDFNGDGEADLAVANSGASSVTVLPNILAPTTSAISSTSPATIISGANVPLTITVSETGPFFNALTGTVTVFDGATNLGTAAQTTTPYTFTVNSPAPGSHSYSAIYGGGSGSTGSSTTTSVAINVVQSQTITFNSLPNVTFGAAPFTISATASSGLTVSFASNTTPVCTVSGTTVTIVAAGACSITASQAGNSSFAAAPPVTQSFTVLQTQTITFNSLPNVTFGAAPFTISATASSGLTVSFASNTTPVCTVSGTTVTIVAAGACSITASQAGNGTFAAAPPVTQSFTVLQTQTITFNSLPNVTFGAAPFTISATASSGLTVSFASNTTPVCTVSGTTVTIVAAGTCSITASQAGNSSFAAAPSVTQSFTVLQTQTITFNSLPNVTFGAAPFTISATASSGLTVSFASNTTPVCTVSGTTVTIVASGTCSITASQAGNGTFAAAPPVTQSFTVLQTQTITFNSLPNVTFGVSPFTINATASSGLTVTFASNTTPVCTVSGTTVTIVAAGACSITASQAGNGTFAAAPPVTQSFTVLQTQTITFNSLPNVTFGAAPFTISATASSGLTVSFASNTTPVCTVSGTTVTIVAIGTCSITASQAGDSTFAAATPVTQTFTVLQTQTITFNALPNVTIGVAPFTISATASSGLTVSFASNTTPVCTVSGTTVTALTPGTCSITASQVGNGTFAAAPPVTQTFNVLAPQTITFDAIPNQIFGLSPFALAAQTNATLPVTFASQTPTVCTTASVTVTILRTGTCSVTASQAGNSNFQPAASVTNSFTVTAANAAGTLSPESLQPAAGTNPWSVAIGDFNGDGHTDVVVASSGSNNVTVLLGDGRGNFTTAPNSPFAAGAQPQSVVTGDFNGDGHQDLAIANSGDNTVTVLLGDGVGGFGAASGSPTAAGTQPAGLAVGDFNGDGIQDLAVAGSSGNTTSLLLGHGTGAFTLAPPSAVLNSINPNAVAVGDINGDGNPDVVIASAGDNTVRVLLGDGAGGFTAAASSPVTVGTQPLSVVIGDFNGDGLADFATANNGSNNVTVMLGDGAGHFASAAGSPFPAGSGPRSLVVFDFNGDRIQDFAVADSAGGVAVLQGSGKGSFFAAGPFNAGTTPYAVAVADFNGDGYEDVVVANQGGGNLSVLLGAVPVVQPPPPPPASLSLTISPNPITTIVGASVTANLNASGGTGGYQFSATGLPAGIVVSGAALSGTATPAGTFSAVVKVLDSSSTVTLTPLTINILGLTTTSLPAGTVGQPYTATLSATGGTAAYTFSATGLPPGVTVSSAGNLSGTPTTAGSFTANVSVTSGGVTSTTALGLAIARPGAIVISNASLPGGMVNVPYSQTITATGGVPPYTFSIATSSPPPGLSMNASGNVSGTPSTPGTFVFGVMTTDTSGGTASAAASITIDAAPLHVTTTSLPSGMDSVPYPTQQFGVAGGVVPFTFSLTGGSLPAGLSFTSDGVLAGTPHLSGSPSSQQSGFVAHASDGTDSFTVAVTVTDGAGTKTNIQLPLSVRPKAADLILTQGNLSFALSSPAQSTPAPQVVGIQSTDPSQVLSYTLAVNPSVSWLAISNSTVTPDSVNVSLTNDALTLTPGTYTTQIMATCTSSSCSGHVLSVAVTLTVTALPPELSVSTDLLSFATTNAATGELNGSLNVTNAGGGVLAFTKVSCEATWCAAGPAPASLAGGVNSTIPVTINPLGLTPNFYRTQVDITTSGGTASVPVTLFISANATMTLSPAGRQFVQLQGSAPGNRSGSYLVAVNSTSPVSYKASIASIQNAAAPSWLVLGNASGSATSAQPGTVTYSIDPAAAAQLPAGAYYAIINVASSQTSNSPQAYEVVLNVAPANTPVAPEPQPAGLLFIKSGNGLPAPQTVNVYSAANQPATYQASATTTSGGNWLSVSPNTGTSSTTSPGVSTVTVDTSKLGPGVYLGGVSYSLSATAVRTVNVTLIIPPTGTSSSSRPGIETPHDVGCKPSALVPAQTGLVNSFSQPAGWPTPLAITLADNCGNLVSNGRIVASFTNGDPPLLLPLADAASALYSGTWSPAHSTSQVTIKLTASAQGFQNASSQITGAVPPNAVPVISPSATLHVFDPLVGGALAPGTIIAVYGQFLASGTGQATTIPLPTNFEDTSVIIGNSYAPIYYASPGQLNVQVPFELTPGQQYELFVSVNGKLSTPQPIQLENVAPGLAAFASGGLIAQHLTDGSLISAASPAVPGEYVQAYLAGLGATTVNVPSGNASPSSPLALPSDPPTLTINGASYPIYFVGLTPTLVGLYQIDFQVPAGLPAGNLNITINQNGTPTNVVTLPYQP